MILEDPVCACVCVYSYMHCTSIKRTGWAQTSTLDWNDALDKEWVTLDDIRPPATTETSKVYTP